MPFSYSTHARLISWRKIFAARKNVIELFSIFLYIFPGEINNNIFKILVNSYVFDIMLINYIIKFLHPINQIKWLGNINANLQNLCTHAISVLVEMAFAKCFRSKLFCILLRIFNLKSSSRRGHSDIKRGASFEDGHFDYMSTFLQKHLVFNIRYTSDVDEWCPSTSIGSNDLTLKFLSLLHWFWYVSKVAF